MLVPASVYQQAAHQDERTVQHVYPTRKMMTKISTVIVLALVALASSAPSGYYPNYAPVSYGGPVPALPPFGAPAVHPAFGYGYGNNGYVTAYRYESNVHSPYRVDSAYAYKVDGQAVQVARVNSH